MHYSMKFHVKLSISLYNTLLTMTNYQIGVNMTSSVSRYATPAVNIDRVLDHRINKNTTTEEFDTVCQEYGIVLEKGESFYGMTPLLLALYRDNRPLVDHIIAVGGKQLLEIGDQNRWTPLFDCFAGIRNYPTAIKLMKLGADVNKTVPEILHPRNRLPERNALWQLVFSTHGTVLKVQYITLKFLLRHGAVAIPELDQRGKKIVAHAEKEMRAPLVAALSNGTVPLAMPLELANITASYVPVDEMVMNDEELEKEVAQVGALWEEIPRQVVDIS